MATIKDDLSVVSKVVDEIIRDYAQRHGRIMRYDLEHKIVIDQEDGTHLVRASVGTNTAKDTKLTLEALSDELKTCFVDWRRTELDLADAVDRLNKEKAKRG